MNGSSSISSNTGFSINPTNNQPTSSTANNASFGLSTNVTLFNGMRNVHELNRTKLNTIASKYRLDDLKDDIRLNVATAYLQVLSNKESLKVFNAQYAVTQQDLKRNKELVESGVVARGDLLDIEATADVDGEFNIGFIRANEYLEYDVNVVDTSDYDVDFRVASLPGGGVISIFVDGAQVGDSVTIASTDGWQNWVTLTMPVGVLNQGQRTVKIRFDNAGLNFNWFEFRF